MANEYLKRLPISTGNTKVWTWASWFKLHETLDVQSAWSWLFNTSVNGGIVINYGGSPYTGVVYWYDHAGSAAAGSFASFRDLNAWYHLTVIYDSTESEDKERIRFYMNGERLEFSDTITPTWPVLNYESSWNTNIIHSIGRWEGGATRYIKAQYSDQFFIDGQALAPDIFGFHKVGDGYMSSGTRHSTNFKPGQWNPRLPKSIKHKINSSGGFGVNGFYLPMNDSSNPGADLHCTPNTIVKLKGEDEPQPRNGAPTTSDSFVSQLREEKGSEDLPFEGVVKFGGDGTSSVLHFPHHSDLDLAGSPFTVECWIYPIDAPSNYYGSLFNKGYGFQVYWKENIQAIQLYGTSVGSGNYDMINGVTSAEGSVPSGKWTHIAVVREPNNIWKIYTNGKLTYGPLNVSGSLHSNTTNWAIGDYLPAPGNYEFNGFISDFRLVKGTAVYTAPFTPPTTRLTNIANTKLLCCQSSTSVTEAAVAPTTGVTGGGANIFATKNEMTGSIVLAVPFISHLIGSNKVTNGGFGIVSDGQPGYDNGDGTVDGWQKNGNSSLSINGNALRFTQTNSGSWQGGNAAYAMGSEFVVGKTYSVKYRIRSSGNGNYSQGVGARIQKGSSWHSSNTEFARDESSDPGTSWTTRHWTWKATQDNYGIEFYNWYGVQNSWIEIDEIEVYEQDTIRDYSADIRGTGTNKTVTVNGSFFVNDYPSHYGSALQCNPANGSYAEVAANAEFANLWDVDHTIEFWYKQNTWDGSYLPHHSMIGLKSGTGCAWRFAFTDKNTAEDGIQLFGTNGFSTGDHTLNNDWNHCVVEQHNDRVTCYLNGVAANLPTAGPVGYEAEKASTGPIVIGTDPRSSALGDTYSFSGHIQDVRIYKGVAKYKGGFDSAKPYTPVNFTGDSWRTNSDNPRNNFCTWNALKAGSSQPHQLTNGNLTMNQSNSYWRQLHGTHGMTTGKFYYEAKTLFDQNYMYIGVADDFGDSENYTSSDNHSWALLTSNGKAYHDQNGGGSISVDLNTSFTNSDVIGVAFDADNGRLWFSKNGTWLNSGAPASGSNPVFDAAIPTGVTYFPAAGCYQESAHVNFGQNPSFCGTVTAGTNADSNGKGLFKYAPPSGFLALCDDNLPAPTIPDPGKHFKTVLWTGDGKTARGINNVGFKPDLVWIKPRNFSDNHVIFDSVTKTALYGNTNGTGNNTRELWGYDSSGFSLENWNNINDPGDTYVAWCWKAGGVAVGNKDGSISSDVSVNETAGFSIVRYTGNGAADATVGHGLPKAPSFIISKNRNQTYNWPTYHKSTQNTGSSATDVVYLDSNIVGNADNIRSVNDTTFATTNWGGINASGQEHIAYCWTEIEGFSKFGKYKGNGSAHGPFAYCGFRPAFVIIKNISATGEWCIWDSSRSPYNEMQYALRSNSADGDVDGFQFDFYSNGFKARDTESSVNSSGNIYIFAAFAESPYKTANAR